MRQERATVLGDLLRRHRLRRGLTQEELAELVGGGLSVDTVANVERGRTRPYRHTLETLLGALELGAAERAEALDAWRAMGRERADGPEAPAPAASLGTPLAPLTRLIGRAREVEELTTLLDARARLVTLTGPGGVGKTRLALAAAEAVRGTFAQGALAVDLAPLSDPRLVLASIAKALGLPDTGDQPYGQRLVSHLRGSHRLLVLDNVEPVVEAAPELAEVLAACPRVIALATSRVPLRVRDEALGDDAAAAAAFAESAAVFVAPADPLGRPWTTLRHGYLRLRQGDLARARALLAESLTGARDLGHTTFALWGLAGCAAVAALDGRDETAVRLFGRAAPLLEAPPGVGGPTAAAARASCGPALDSLRARVRPAAFAEGRAAGQAMSLDEAIALALASLCPTEASRPPEACTRVSPS